MRLSHENVWVFLIILNQIYNLYKILYGKGGVYLMVLLRLK